MYQRYGRTAKRRGAGYDPAVPAERRPAEEIRRAVVAAAISVIGERGLAACTHRAVAERAGVSLSSTTYHFASRADILRAALRAVADEERDHAAAGAEALRAAVEGGAPITPEAIAGALAAHLLEGPPERVRAGYELQLRAVDDPSLQPDVQRWYDDTSVVVRIALEALGSRDPGGDACLVVAAGDGLRLSALTTPDSPTRATDMQATLTRLVTAIAAPHA